MSRYMKDPYKPNFIHSSDIPRKVDALAEIHGHGQELPTIHFNVNIELNSLFIRNKQLKPSVLIRSNHLSLAKSRKSKKDKKKHQVCLIDLSTDEIYIVCLVLTAIATVRSNELSIVFVEDENLAILGEFKENLLHYVQATWKSVIESGDLTRTASMDSLVDADSKTSDTTQSGDECDYKGWIDNKSQSTIDLDEKGDLTTLRSLTEDVDLPKPTEKILSETKTTGTSIDASSILTNIPTKLESPKKPIPDAQTHVHSDTPYKPVSQSSTLRLNTLNNALECEKTQSPCNAQPTEDKNGHEISSGPSGYVFIDIDSMGSVSPTSQSEADPILLDTIHGLKNPQSDDEERKTSPLDEIPIMRHKLRRPSRVGSPRLSQKSSFADLDPEPVTNNVPTYMKDSKKYKYIKVGKVQKFVHLFEEQMKG